MRELRHVPELRASRPCLPRGGARRRRHAARADRALIAIAIAIAACHKHDAPDDLAEKAPLTPAQQQAKDAAIAKARAAIIAADAPWNEAVARFDPGLVSADAPPCAALDFARAGLAGNPQGGEWGEWPATSPLGFNSSSIASFTHAPFPIAFVHAEDPRPPHSPEATALLARLDRGDDSIDELRTTDVLVRLDDVVEPVLGTHQRYSPGSITARVLVFDHSRNALVCAGIVHAESSPTVDPGSSNLDDDLMISFMRALPAGVHAIGGPP